MADYHSDVSRGLAHLESRSQVYAQVSALEGGWFTLPLRFFIAGVSENEKSYVPSLAFLITRGNESAGPKHTLFDLGLRQNTTTLEQPIQNHLLSRQPTELSPDVRESLAKAGTSTDVIEQVILSHLHWDHIGTPLDFRKAQFRVGAGSLPLLETGLNSHMSHSHFQSDLFDGLNVQEFPAPMASQDNRTHSTTGSWDTVGEMPLLDLYGDGSVYVVDLPGHLSGHVGALVHTGPRSWVLLAGDACHDSRLLSGEKDIAEWEDAYGRVCCIHADRSQTEKTLDTLRRWLREAKDGGYDFRILLAHDALWAKSNPETFYPGHIN
ncbi:hypothetical protein PFICI_07610 [Pestalotiopsis fici W106-1]|uniref:Metallo-beta-lactamase domain-containing protein n=1 Tax=Pestalotiopsis fici (strain W106-1 / CGMCC3.15140) TaxID=1229662 RepID=W3X4H6_PESFW|nr:uncharacterized protein PFICI_07610 [Pestalotiopsis fici W106-1]ETS80081.1 hypothetical protein PFICI_07610 [Pestalotiopsis fici W106-1]